jgi:DNA-binding response OmpR family regulator
LQTKLLVIDDDLEMTDLLKTILEPASFTVFTANSGTQGVESTRSLDPDVIILDLLMPGVDGLQVCREIRKFNQAPILVMSAVSKPGMAARALDEGADDYLLKPAPTSILIAHLKKLTRRARAEREAIRAKNFPAVKPAL